MNKHIKELKDKAAKIHADLHYDDLVDQGLLIAPENHIWKATRGQVAESNGCVHWICEELGSILDEGLISRKQSLHPFPEDFL